MEIAVADVRKVLASVGGICDVGNTVTFRSCGGEIESVATGRKIKMARKPGGSYTFNMWVTGGRTGTLRSLLRKLWKRGPEA